MTVLMPLTVSSAGTTRGDSQLTPSLAIRETAQAKVVQQDIKSLVRDSRGRVSSKRKREGVDPEAAEQEREEIEARRRVRAEALAAEAHKSPAKPAPKKTGRKTANAKSRGGRRTRGTG
jgi:hypothetical protein